MARGRTSGGDPAASILTAIEKGEVAPLYVLYGDDPDGIGRVVRALRRAVLTEGFEAFNHERFEGRELTDVGPVLAACAQLPTLAARRLVELADPDQVGDKKASGDATADAYKDVAARLTAYYEDPNPTTVLVLSGKIDGRSKLVSKAKKVGVVQKFGALGRDADAVAFVSARARDEGVELAREAAEQIVAAVGTAPAALADALEKARLHAGSTRVTAADVDAVVTRTREAVVFELTDAVGAGQLDRALQVLRAIFDERAMPERSQALALVSMLARQIRLIFVARFARGNLAAVAGVPPFVARKLQDQARNFDEATLRAAHGALFRLDQDLKGGSAVAGRSPALAIERFVVQVCGQASSRRG